MTPSPRRPRGATRLWLGVLGLCAAGIVLALLDLDGGASGTAADGSFHGAAPASPQPARPRAASSAPAPRTAARPVDPAEAAARTQEADALIEQLVRKLRAERRARAEARRGGAR